MWKYLGQVVFMWVPDGASGHKLIMGSQPDFRDEQSRRLWQAVTGLLQRRALEGQKPETLFESTSLGEGRANALALAMREVQDDPAMRAFLREPASALQPSMSVAVFQEDEAGVVRWRFAPNEVYRQGLDNVASERREPLRSAAEPRQTTQSAAPSAAEGEEALATLQGNFTKLDQAYKDLQRKHQETSDQLRATEQERDIARRQTFRAASPAGESTTLIVRDGAEPRRPRSDRDDAQSARGRKKLATYMRTSRANTRSGHEIEQSAHAVAEEELEGALDGVPAGDGDGAAADDEVDTTGHEVAAESAQTPVSSDPPSGPSEAAEQATPLEVVTVEASASEVVSDGETSAPEAADSSHVGEVPSPPGDAAAVDVEAGDTEGIIVDGSPAPEGEREQRVEGKRKSPARRAATPDRTWPQQALARAAATQPAGRPSMMARLEDDPAASGSGSGPSLRERAASNAKTSPAARRAESSPSGSATERTGDRQFKSILTKYNATLGKRTDANYETVSKAFEKEYGVEKMAVENAEELMGRDGVKLKLTKSGYGALYVFTGVGDQGQTFVLPSLAYPIVTGERAVLDGLHALFGIQEGGALKEAVRAAVLDASYQFIKGGEVTIIPA